MPQSEREAYLDNQIRQMEFMRQAFEAGKSVMGAIGWSKKKSDADSSKTSTATKNNGEKEGPPWMKNRSEDERNAWRKKMIDRTTPEQRAKFGEYFSAMKSLLIALSVVLVSSVSIQISKDIFSIKDLMISYMGIFFLIFSFLKLVDVKGFRESLAKYDLIAKIIPGFAILYPFFEFILAIVRLM